MALEKTTTSEGLRVYVDTIPTARTANIQAFVESGSVHETEDEAGVCHALEHCVHVTEMFPTRQDLRDFDGENSILSNANTSYNRTIYFGAGPFVDPIMKRLGEVLFRATFTPDHIENEVKAINHEAEMYLDDIDNIHRNAVYYGLFGKPYGRDILGYTGKLSFTPDQLHEYYRQHYIQSNMALVAVGNVQMDDILQGVDRYFEKQSAARSPVVPLAPQRLDARTTGLKLDTENARVSVSIPMDKQFVQKYLDRKVFYDTAIEVIRAQCLESVRFDAGIAYQADAHIRTWNDPNAWLIVGNAVTAPETVVQASTIISDVMHRPSASYSDKKIMSAIGRMRSFWLMHLDSVDGRVDMHVGNLERKTAPDDPDEFANIVLGQTQDDIRVALDDIVDYLGTQTTTTHTTGPKRAIKGVDKLIKQSMIV